MRHRSAATLVEVLVAIFVTAIGLLALLALFPLGALTMAQAIKDDRTAHAAANARAIAATLTQLDKDGVLLLESSGIRNDRFLVDASVPVPAPQSNDTFLTPNTVLNGTPGTGYYQTAPGGILPPAHSDLPSYPIYVDPAGFRAYSGVLGAKDWVCAVPGVLPRRTLSLMHPSVAPANQIANTINWFTLLDDMNFVRDRNPASQPFLGLPCPPGGTVERDGRYSWAYLLRRPRSVDRTVVDMSVVVYSQRPLALNFTGAPQPLGETAYLTPKPIFAPMFRDTLTANRRGDNIVSITWPNGVEKPALRKGGWILDASVERLGAPNPLNGFGHAFFYRVVGLTDTGTNSMDLELQTPLREDVYSTDYSHNESLMLTGTPTPRVREGQILVLENVVEVFEMGAGWQP